MSENTPLKRAIELCLAVYRIADKFPHGEILKQKLHTKSIDILEDLVYNEATPTNSSRIFNSRNLEQKIRVLFAYFSVAENQGWLDRRNFTLLRGEYRKLYVETLNSADRSEKLKAPVSSTVKRSQERHAPVKKQTSLTARQEIILRFLKTKEGGQAVSDIAQKIETSNKTAERELKNLIGRGQARKQGNTRGARFLVVG